MLPSARKKRFSAVQRHYGPDLLRRNYAAHQIPHAHQVVGRAGEREDPIDFQRSAMPHFAHQRNSFQPAKTFFDALPLLLADDIAALPRCAAIMPVASHTRQFTASAIGCLGSSCSFQVSDFRRSSASTSADCVCRDARVNDPQQVAATAERPVGVRLAWSRNRPQKRWSQLAGWHRIRR